MAGHSMNFQPDQKYSKRTNLAAGRQIVEIKIHSSIKNFQPGIPIAIGTNSEQKVDKMHVSPAIANALVVRSPCCQNLISGAFSTLSEPNNKSVLLYSLQMSLYSRFAKAILFSHPSNCIKSPGS